MNNLLNEIKNLSTEIESISTKVEDMELKIQDAEMKQLDDILKVCKGGFKFNKIISKKTTWNNHINWRDDEVEYFDDKGVFLTEKNTYTNRNVYASKYIDYELWLMRDGSLSIYKCVTYDNNLQDESNFITRCYVNNNALDYFDVDDIMDGIKDALQRRLESLNNRTKAQEERIKKLEEYM